MGNELLDVYLTKCSEACNLGGYTKLSESWKVIRQDMAKNFPDDNSALLLEKYERILSDYCEKLRIFKWEDVDEKVLRDKLLYDGRC